MKNYESYFGHDPSFIRRMMRYLGLDRTTYRRRDDCPEWVRDAAIAKAADKRAMRAEKRLALAQAGSMQMLAVTKKKKRRLFGTKVPG